MFNDAEEHQKACANDEASVGPGNTDYGNKALNRTRNENTTVNVNDMADKETTKCPLLALPTEIQLQILGYLLLSPTQPLLINCPCKLSFKARHEAKIKFQHEWEVEYQKSPPTSFPIMQSCKSLRKLAAEIYFGQNIFRAGYCPDTGIIHLKYSTASRGWERKETFGFESALSWLRRLGAENRARLKHFYFYERNERHFNSSPKYTRKLVDVVRELDGRSEVFSKEDVLGDEHQQPWRNSPLKYENVAYRVPFGHPLVRRFEDCGLERLIELPIRRGKEVVLFGSRKKDVDEVEVTKLLMALRLDGEI